MDSFEFSFDIALAPKVEISLTKREKIPYYTIAITDDLIDGQVKTLTSRFGENKVVEAITEKSLVKGDLVQIDKEGNVLDGGIFVEDASLSVSVVKDKKEQKKLLEKSANDEVVFDLKKAYPNDTEVSYILKISKEEAADVKDDFR